MILDAASKLLGMGVFAAAVYAGTRWYERQRSIARRRRMFAGNTRAAYKTPHGEYAEGERVRLDLAGEAPNARTTQLT